MFAGARGLSLPRRTRSGCSPSRPCSRFRWPSASGSVATTFRHLGFAADGLRLIRDEEFTSRFLEVGQPEIDELIARLQPHGRSPARGAGAARASSIISSARSCSVSRPALSIFDFDQRVTTINPAAERLLDTARGRDRRASARERWIAARSGAGGVRAGRRLGRRARGARRVKCQRGTFVDRGFTTKLPPDGGTHRGAAAVRARGLREADPRHVPRGQQHGWPHPTRCCTRRSTTPASSARPAATTSRRRIGIVIERTEQLNAFMRGFADVFRLPPPLLQPTDVVALLESIVRLLSARPRRGRDRLAMGSRAERRSACRWIAARWSRRCSMS